MIPQTHGIGSACGLGSASARPARPRLLLLGGTAEARLLAVALSDRPHLDVTFSLAGATPDPRLPPVRIRRGGFGGADGLQAYLHRRRIDAVIDATHPYALRIGAHVARAAEALDLPALTLLRPPWRPEPGRPWTVAADPAEAARLIEGGRRVFVALGSRGAEAFLNRPDLHILLRRMTPPPAPLPAGVRLIIGAPGDLDDEIALFRRFRIDVLVTRNSGGQAGRPKLAAARQTQCRIVVIDRPPIAAGTCVASIEAALGWIETRFPPPRLEESNDGDYIVP